MPVPIWLPASLGAQRPRLDADWLHLWWWPQAQAEPAPSRRVRIDRLLRLTLAGYLALPPPALRFSREARGRPFLEHPGAPDFNLSDTRGGTLIAVAGGGRVGVDLEHAERRLPALKLARRWFSAEEAAALAELEPMARERAFLRLWTAKEAACKATGSGIYGRLADWRFAIETGDDGFGPQPIAPLPEEAGAAGQWRFHRLAPPGGFTAALACQGVRARPRCMIVAGDGADPG